MESLQDYLDRKRGELRRHRPGIVTKRLKPATEMMRTDTDLDARMEAKLAANWLRDHFLMQHNGAALILAGDMESILADIDTDYGDCSVGCL